MESIYIHLEHCYGIPSFICTFRFDTEAKKAHLIYAPNGTMKSSFAHTLNDICADSTRESRDRYFPSLPYKRIVKHGSATGDDYTKEEILVVESFKDDYESSRMNVLVADRELKSRYDLVQHEIEGALTRLLAALNNLSEKRPASIPFMKDFSIKEDELLITLATIYDEYKGKVISEYPDIKYASFFTDDAEKVLTDIKVVRSIDTYFEQYLALVTKSDVFDAFFNHNNAESTLESLSKNGFFKASHKVQLKGSELGLGEEDYAEAIKKEKKRIIEEELTDEFQKLDDALNAKNGTRNLRAYLATHKTIIPELHDLGELKKRIWIYYLFQNEPLFHEAVLCFRRNIVELKEIINTAKTQTTQWQAIVEEFNNRFVNMPFTLEIENKEDVILKELKPTLAFQFRRGNDSVPAKKEQLLETLSEGEKKALYLLNILFEIRARENLSRKTLIILDDIADSFDYKNKYAIIEYLIDIIEGGYFLPIILTHNFDFYRTLGSRGGLVKSCHFVIPKSNEIELSNGEYLWDVFDTWRKGIHNNSVIFIASIAFARNLVQYKSGKETIEYELLTRLLHYKKNKSSRLPATEKIQLFDLFKLFPEIIDIEDKDFSFDPNESVYNFIIRYANEITVPPADPIKLENKILLAIAIRLITDKYMILRIGDDETTDKIASNQTRELKKLIHFDRENLEDVEREKIIDKVLIVSSENIHLNSFMYEPIIDLSLDELMKLYDDVSHKLRWKD